MRRAFLHVWRLGMKELWSLRREPVMLILIAYVFTVSIYTAATAMPETLHNAVTAVVDEDRSPLSSRIVSALPPPHLNPPAVISHHSGDPGIDAPTYTFALIIPSGFQRDMLAG